MDSNTTGYLKTPGQQSGSHSGSSSGSHNLSLSPQQGPTRRTRSISQPRPFQQPPHHSSSLHQSFGYGGGVGAGQGGGGGSSSGAGGSGGKLGGAGMGLRGGQHARSLSRSLSNNAIQKVNSSGLGLAFGGAGGGGGGGGAGGGGTSSSSYLGGSDSGMGDHSFYPNSGYLLDNLHGHGHPGEGSTHLNPDKKSHELGGTMSAAGGVGGMTGGGGVGAGGKGGRTRSASLVTVTEVGGDDGDQVVDRLGVGVNENANWVNAPGAWLIHPVIILIGKVLIDSIPNMKASYSWTIINLGYVLASYTMFHSVTGVPFESSQPSGGAYDDLTLWEQIDAGAQYTPAKKWLTSVPIFLFLISTHYVKYDPKLFFINFAACVFVLFPKLPALHRLRFHFTPLENKSLPSNGVTPNPSRPASPHPPGLRMSTLDPIIESRRS